MKIIFLIKSEKTPSSRIRVRELLPFLEKKGLDCTVLPLPETAMGKLSLFPELRKYDLVVLQKRLLSLLEFKLLRLFARRLAFDFDDAIYLRNASPSENPEDYRSSTRQTKFRRTILGADLVMSSGPVLDAYVKSIAPEKAGRIIPTAVDVSSIKAKDNWDLSDVPVIGWTGTKSTIRYVEYIAPALRALAQKHKYVLKIVADAAPLIEGVDIKFVPWKLESQYDEIRSFDVGIMPLSSDPFSEGKAAYKLLQYFACAVPSVLSPVGVNRIIAESETHPCLSAESVDSFREHLDSLLSSRELRARLAMSGRRLAESAYSFEAAAEAFLKAVTV